MRLKMPSKNYMFYSYGLEMHCTSLTLHLGLSASSKRCLRAPGQLFLAPGPLIPHSLPAFQPRSHTLTGVVTATQKTHAAPSSSGHLPATTCIQREQNPGWRRGRRCPWEGWEGRCSSEQNHRRDYKCSVTNKSVAKEKTPQNQYICFCPFLLHVTIQDHCKQRALYHCDPIHFPNTTGIRHIWTKRGGKKTPTHHTWEIRSGFHFREY